jgi:two-component system OmpR family sensor kinase
MRSIRRELLVWLLAGFSLATIAAAVGVYRQARVEARELFDYQLHQMATAFPKEGFGPLPVTSDPFGVESVVAVQIWDRNGLQTYLSRPGTPPPESPGMGYSTVSTLEGDWRIYSAVRGNNVIQVSQPTSVRDALAATMALRTMLPLAALLPVLIGLTWVTVGRGLKPLNEVASIVGTRSADALHPVSEQRLPSEVIPLVDAINDLLKRLARALSLQRSFIADAAHELRTPLTALLLQIQVVERATTDAERSSALVRLKGGMARAIRLVEQLLTLARNEPEAAERHPAPVDLAEVAHEVVAERALLADEKGIDLGLKRQAAPVLGDNEALRALIGNLVDNAIHHTPSGGIVDVEAMRCGDEARLLVRDTGPGLPEAERARVFDRFYRGENARETGSGLGLAIVRKIAERHHATIELATGAAGRGLEVTIRFPTGS